MLAFQLLRRRSAKHGTCWMSHTSAEGVGHEQRGRASPLRDCFVLGLALPHFATHFGQACLRLVHQNESHKLASLRKSCHIFYVYAMWGPSVACLRCGLNQTLTEVGQTFLTLGVAIFGKVSHKPNSPIVYITGVHHNQDI